MAISFNSPIVLLLIPLVIFLIIYFKDRLSGMEKDRKRLIIICRLLIFVLLILALSGLNIKTYVDTVTTIFAVDLSESTKDNHDEYRSFIESSLEYSTERDKVGIVAFGKESEIESAVGNAINDVEFLTDPGNQFTNIEKALEISQAVLPQDTMKRVVLLTDGEENIGDSLKKGNILKYNDIQLKVFKTEREETEEVQLKSLFIPKILYENQSFDIVANIYSNVKTKGILTLYQGRQVIGEEEVILEEGDNRFIFKDKAIESGFKPYKAMISPERDTIVQNNSYVSFTEIRGVPRILLVDGEENGGRELEKILTSSDIMVEYVKDVGVPTTLTELLKYKTIIMCDVSLENIDKKFIESLKSYVKDYGGGLVVTGGENSYALGGYYKTPLEEILPVEMEMKIKGEVPNLGIVLVIDKSGSMSGDQYGVNKIEIAKEAAIRTLNALKLKDKIGVIAFDDAVQWVVELKQAENKEEIINDIGTIRAGGGTSILPALEEAYFALKDADTKMKHVILLTDGHAEQSGYDELIKNMRKSGITISTIAVGQDADKFLLENIAKNGKGRFYSVAQFSNIPEIFTKETFLASKVYINNRLFNPRLGTYNEIIEPFMGGIPSLKGYIGTTAKDRANVVLWSDKDDPILALWQYGLGKSVAWTSDVNGKWSSEYLNSEEGIRFLINMVEWTFPVIDNNNLLVETTVTGDTGEIFVENQDFNQEYITKATIISPQLDTEEVKLHPTKPGKYSGSFQIKEEGVYIAKVTQYDGDEIVSTATGGLAVNYSKEFDITSLQNRLDTLVNLTEGKFITKPEEVFTYDLKNIKGSKDMTKVLLIIALILFIIDIALRRLNIRFGKLKPVREKTIKDSKAVIKPRKEKRESDDISKQNTQDNKSSSKNQLDTSRLLKVKNKK